MTQNASTPTSPEPAPEPIGLRFVGLPSAECAAAIENGRRLVITATESAAAVAELDPFGQFLFGDLCDRYRQLLKDRKKSGNFEAHRDGCFEGVLRVFALLYQFPPTLDAWGELRETPEVNYARWETIVQEHVPANSWVDQVAV